MKGQLSLPHSSRVAPSWRGSYHQSHTLTKLPVLPFPGPRNTCSGPHLGAQRSCWFFYIQSIEIQKLLLHNPIREPLLTGLCISHLPNGTQMRMLPYSSRNPQSRRGIFNAPILNNVCALALLLLLLVQVRGCLTAELRIRQVWPRAGLGVFIG